MTLLCFLVYEFAEEMIKLIKHQMTLKLGSTLFIINTSLTTENGSKNQPKPTKLINY